MSSYRGTFGIACATATNYDFTSEAVFCISLWKKGTEIASILFNIYGQYKLNTGY